MGGQMETTEPRLAEQIVNIVRSYRDSQPTEALRLWADNILLHELLAAAHACDDVRRFEEQRAEKGGEPPEVVRLRAEVAGWGHLIHEASKRLHRAEADLAEARTLRVVPS
jgi:hypothetical protein